MSQQCPRDNRCDKPRGHAGWCRTQGGARSGAARRSSGAAAADRIVRMAALGAQRGMTKAERRQQRVEEEWGGTFVVLGTTGSGKTTLIK